MNAEVGFPQTTIFTTSDGFELEAEFLLPAQIQAIAVLSHPHPLYGGDMRNNVIQSLFESLPESSIGTLRYNFRGAGVSEGTHGKGELERLDAEAAFTYAGSLGDSIPIISVGYSFGADVSLSTDHSSLAGWVGIAAPLSLLKPQQMPAGHDERPTLLLVPQHDQYRSPDEAATISHSWDSTSLSIIDGGDHFLMGSSKPVSEATAAFVKKIIES
jgi:alpha/beta superfamily hydrolase